MENSKRNQMLIFGVTLILFLALIGEYWLSITTSVEGNGLLRSVLTGYSRVGTIIRILFVLFYFLCFYVVDQSVEGKLKWKKEVKSSFLERYKYYGISAFIIGGAILGTIENFIFFELLYPLAMVMVLVGGYLVGNLLRPSYLKYDIIKTDTSPLRNQYSFNIPSTDNRFLNIPNPFRGIFMMAGSGSGKSVIAEWVIKQAAEKRYCGIIYDYKFPTLTDFAYTHYKDQDDIDFKIINFTDLSRTNRINPIKPSYISHNSFAAVCSQALISNLAPETIENKDYWIRSSACIVTAVMIYLRNNHPAFCTIPHIMHIILGHKYSDVIKLIETDYDASMYMRTVLTAYESKAEGQLSGVFGTLQSILPTVTTPEACYVLSGDDFGLDLNDVDKPVCLCLGTQHKLNSVISPLLSLVVTMSLNRMNEPDKQHAIVLLDEAPQMYIPNLADIPATGRSNKICVFYIAQDYVQMLAQYGETEAKKIIANLNNQIYGRSSEEGSIKRIINLFGDREEASRSQNRNISSHSEMFSFGKSNIGSGENMSVQRKSLLRSEDITGLKSGEVLGFTVDAENPEFFLRVKYAENAAIEQVPEFNLDYDVQICYERIKAEAHGIVKGFIPPRHSFRIVNDVAELVVI